MPVEAEAHEPAGTNGVRCILRGRREGLPARDPGAERREVADSEGNAELRSIIPFEAEAKLLGQAEELL